MPAVVTVFLESSLRVERLVDQSASLGYRHVALTDKDAMFAVMKFYKYALSKKHTSHSWAGTGCTDETGTFYFLILLAKK